ncbi:MAG: hypothetical protein J6A69_06970 [Clostridia bacterium]|nr:hypothetical protein [Clostridia bacterium]
MLKNKVMFFNAQEVVETKIGYKIYRFDRETLSHINSNENGSGNWIGRYSCGTEIRFYSDSNIVTVTLLPEISDGNLCVYLGNYFVGRYELKAGEYKTLFLKRPEMFDNINADFFDGNTFDNHVWRLCPHNCLITLCDIDNTTGVIRPPKKSEMPSKTMLAYGSSITHGSGALSNPYCYIENVGRLLGLNILNKGMGGSCFCEKEVVDMLLKNDFDYAYLECGVNMYMRVEPEEFRKRFTYLVAEISKKTVPVFITTAYRFSTYYFNDENKLNRINEYNQIIREVFDKYKKDNWKLLDGMKILNDTTYLTVDGIHPSTEGHFQMAYNIVREIKDIINK